MKETCIFGVDLGGTQIKIGKFVNDKLVLNYAIDTDVSCNGKNIIPDICKSIKENLNNNKLTGIGIGVPGPVCNGKVLGAQNIGWEEIDVKKEVEKYFSDVIIKVLNDANAATLGESYCGSAKGYKNVVMLTLGTGLGGGIIINGQVYEGNNGSSGEVGHICLDPDGRECTCGLRGCLEQYASATGVVKTALEKRKGKDTMLNVPTLTCKDVFDFANDNDAVALEVVDDVTNKLAIGCAAICNTLNPDILLLGGGVSKAKNSLLIPVREKFLKYAFYSVRSTRIELATLGNDAGIWGNFCAVRSDLDESNSI